MTSPIELFSSISANQPIKSKRVSKARKPPSPILIRSLSPSLKERKRDVRFDGDRKGQLTPLGQALSVSPWSSAFFALIPCLRSCFSFSGIPYFNLLLAGCTESKHLHIMAESVWSTLLFPPHALPSHVFSELDMPVGGLQTPSIIGRQGRKARVRNEDLAQERQAKTWIRQLEKAREGFQRSFVPFTGQWSGEGMRRHYGRICFRHTWLPATENRSTYACCLNSTVGKNLTYRSTRVIKGMLPVLEYWNRVSLLKDSNFETHTSIVLQLQQERFQMSVIKTIQEKCQINEIDSRLTPASPISHQTVS